MNTVAGYVTVLTPTYVNCLDLQHCLQEVLPASLALFAHCMTRVSWTQPLLSVIAQHQQLVKRLSICPYMVESGAFTQRGLQKTVSL